MEKFMTTIQEITLGGGCFWCIESAFNKVKGVVSAHCGYSNGHTNNPTYEQVCSGTTGHNEVVRVVFDSDVISLQEIFEIFFALHDPTQLNRQGNDKGTQYRGGIYYHNAQQQAAAQAFVAQLTEDNVYDEPVVTEIEALDNYTQAEDYHQDYFANNPSNTYCNLVVGPKLVKFKKTFAARLKS
jgi:peptide-methionine (S)-S-oxide reductase